MSGEQALDDRPLDTHPPPVDQAHLREASLRRLGQILFDDGRDVAGRERVQVESVLDRQDDGIRIVRLVVHDRDRVALPVGPAWRGAPGAVRWAGAQRLVPARGRSAAITGEAYRRGCRLTTERWPP